jgi:aryl-alcohol dehydrogenase-like predicted oxidoreductase
MEQIEFVKSDLITSRIGLGTWAMGGWMWGGTDEAQSIATIRSAIDRGVTLIDTAPVYGFGRSEEIVGKALEGSLRQKVTIATKVGLAWKDDAVYRDSRPARIRKEIEDSLRRLHTDVIDLYQVHWPDFETPIAETARTLEDLRREGKIRAIGVSNFSPTQMRMFSADAQLDAVQPPYNLFERDIEVDVLPYAVGAGLTVLSYGPLCRGLLSGRMGADTKFNGDDLRNVDPKFQGKRYLQYLAAVDEPRSWHTNASANRCWRLRCVGCSIKDRRLPCGVPAILVSWTRLVMSRAGTSTRLPKPKSTPFLNAALSIQYRRPLWPRL